MEGIGNVKVQGMQMPAAKLTQKTFAPVKKENKHNTTKVVMSGLAALAAIGLAAIAIKKGNAKGAKTVETAIGGAKPPQTAPVSTATTEEVLSEAQQIKNARKERLEYLRGKYRRPNTKSLSEFKEMGNDGIKYTCKYRGYGYGTVKFGKDGYIYECKFDRNSSFDDKPYFASITRTNPITKEKEFFTALGERYIRYNKDGCPWKDYRSLEQCIAYLPNSKDYKFIPRELGKKSIEKFLQEKGISLV